MNVLSLTLIGRPRPPGIALAALAADAVLATAGLAGCGSSDASVGTSTSPASTPASSAASTRAATPSASDTPTAEGGVSVDVTFSGDTALDEVIVQVQVQVQVP